MTPMVDRFMRGESCVVFAYGITNAGKTHTIQGTPTDYGILPRLISKLLDNFPQTELKFSMFEIYQEKIYDLLNKRALLNIRDANKKVEVSSLSLHPIANAKDAIKMMNKGASKRYHIYFIST
jgi:kinesin family protein 22